MRITLLIIQLVLVASLCVAKTAPIIIHNESKGNVFGFFYCDKFNDLKTSLALRQKDLSGKYSNRYELATDVPVIVVFTKGGLMSAYPVLLFPGDTCSVYSEKDGFTFRGSSHEIGDLNIISELEQAHGFTLPDNMGLTISNRLNLMYVVENITTTYLDRKRFIDDYQKQYVVSNQYKISLEKIIRQKYILSLLFPVYASQDSIGYNFESLPSEYHAILSKEIEGVLDDSQIYLQTYQVLLWNYCKYLSRSYLNSSEEFNVLFSNALNNFSGKSRDFLLFLILKKYAGKGLPKFQSSVETFLVTCPNSEYKDYLFQFIPNNQTNKMLIVSEEKLTTYEDTEITWKNILDSMKGKVVYIDFWASWCKPCLQEMPYSDKLRDSLSAEGIMFLYVSIDQKKDAWIRAINKLKQAHDKHFLFQSNSQLKDVFSLQAIPRYVIIDKRGNIFSSDALRPSDPRLKDILLKLQGE